MHPRTTFLFTPPSSCRSVQRLRLAYACTFNDCQCFTLSHVVDLRTHLYLWSLLFGKPSLAGFKLQCLVCRLRTLQSTMTKRIVASALVVTELVRGPSNTHNAPGAVSPSDLSLTARSLPPSRSRPSSGAPHLEILATPKTQVGARRCCLTYHPHGQTRSKPSTTPFSRSRSAKFYVNTPSPNSISFSMLESGITISGGIQTIPASAPAQSSGRGW